MVRQGDVLLVPVASIPADAKPGRREKGRIVLAYGEVTGHAHSIAAPWVVLLEDEGTRYIRVPMEGAELHHEEHAAIRLTPGEYRIVIQREYTPETVRWVRD